MPRAKKVHTIGGYRVTTARGHGAGCGDCDLATRYCLDKMADDTWRPPCSLAGRYPDIIFKVVI